MNRIRACILNIIPTEHSWKISLLESWGNIVGDLKNTVTIEQIKGDVLFLGVEHPAWAQELMALLPVIKKNINGHFNEERIKAVRIRLKKETPSKIVHRVQAEQKKVAVKLDYSEEFALSCVKNDDLKLAMHDFYLKCKSKKSIS